MSQGAITNKSAHLPPAYFNLLTIEYHMCLVTPKADCALEISLSSVDLSILSQGLIFLNRETIGKGKH